ncbi:hypothetical protein HDE76_000804 [Rhodanobacter sp. ANJX3]|uniref:hypothetical protein n=1 Tax=Rhodanobacter sp. ANJX3 TaxID=2723083 RepID=UPI00160904A0|nr:hypothetical protein [Rhodanobacter sp. ANJX3]MBB5357622.1 hypothetical protein [Rhodanobacter sp. ANJX3]
MSYVANDGLIQDELALAHPTMRFSAIIAGWLVATATAGLLYCAGLALGFAGFDAWNAAGSAKGVGIGTAVWMIITWAAALFIGGMFAAWFDGRNDDTSGALHGVTVWGLSLTTTALWLALGLGHAMSGHNEHMGGPGSDMHGGAPAMTPAVSVLDANIAYALTGRERGGSAPIVGAILAGQDDIATALLAADTGTSQDSAAASLQKLTPQIDAARSESKMAADKAAHYLSLTLWIAFISGFLALLASAVGGWLGAGHIHRVYHLRKYPVRRVA